MAKLQVIELNNSMGGFAEHVRQFEDVGSDGPPATLFTSTAYTAKIDANKMQSVIVEPETEDGHWP